MVGLKDYINRRKQSKLFKQWVQQSGLPAEEIPPDLRDDQEKTSRQAVKMEATDTSYSIKREMISIPVKYLLFIILLIAALLVALSVVTTLLLTSS
jgi:hypothetical protein